MAKDDQKSQLSKKGTSSNEVAPFPVSTLTAKQQMFVLEYLVDLNATQAAIRAGYSQKTAEQIGYENLRKPEIAAAIAEAMASRSKKVSVTTEDVLKSIVDIRGMAIGSDKLNEALKANELLGRHLKMFTDKVEHTGAVDITRIMGAAARAGVK